METILRSVIEDDTELRWIRGVGCERGKVEVRQLVEEEVEEWSDGSRANGRAAGATRTRGLYLGEWATVADAEGVGVLLAWEDYDRVALDSQGVVQRIWNLRYDQPRSWIEERLVEQMRERPRTLMWVRGTRE